MEQPWTEKLAAKLPLTPFAPLADILIVWIPVDRAETLLVYGRVPCGYSGDMCIHNAEYRGKHIHAWAAFPSIKHIALFTGLEELQFIERMESRTSATQLNRRTAVGIRC